MSWKSKLMEFSISREWRARHKLYISMENKIFLSHKQLLKALYRQMIILNDFRTGQNWFYRMAQRVFSLMGP